MGDKLFDFGMNMDEEMDTDMELMDDDDQEMDAMGFTEMNTDAFEDADDLYDF